MSLPVGQQRTLDGIAETLRRTEPRLTVMFAIFTRLTKDEPPPCREQLAARKRVAWLPARWQRPLGSQGNRRGLAWRHLLIISQLALAVITLVVLTCLTAHSAAGCGVRQRSRADAVSVSHQPACPQAGPSGIGLTGK
jgi:hypothetical protein